MSSLSILAGVLTLAPPVAQAALFLQAARRKLLREYSLFMWYTGLQIAKGGLYAIVDHHTKVYFVAYWLGELVDIPLVIAVLYQLYSRLLRGFEALQRLQDLLFRWSAAMTVLVAVTTAAATPGTDATDRLVAAVLSLDLAASVLKAGLIIFLILMSSALSLRWTPYAFGILAGMGLYNAVVLGTVAARAQFGGIAAVPYALIKVGAYNCAIVVWLVCFFGRVTVRESVNSLPPANNLVSWNQALLELLPK